MARRFAKMVLPGVAVGVKVQQPDGAVAGVGGAQQRQGDGVVAAQKHAMVLRHQRRGSRLDRVPQHRQRRGIGQT